MPSVGTITGTLRLVDIFTGPLAIAGTQLAKTATTMQAVGASMATAGAKLSTGLTLPIVAAAGASFFFASTFQESMTKVETLSGAGRENIQGWRQDLLDLAVEAGRSPKELADALFFLSSSGLELSEVMEVLEVSAKGAALGLGDTELLASTLTVVTNAYTETNLRAADALNTLALGVKTGAAEVSDFAPAMGRVAGMAANMGIAFEEVVGVLSVMSLTNNDVAETATSLSQIFNTLLGSGKQARDTLHQMGLTFAELRDMASKPGGLIAVMKLLDESFSMEELKLIVPNIRAFRGFMNVLSQDSEAVAEIMAEVAAGVDVLGVGFRRVAEDPGFKFRQLMSAILVELIRLGDSAVFGRLFENMQSLVRVLGSVVEGFSNLPKPIRDVAVGTIFLLAVLGPILSVGGRAILVFSSMAKVVKTLAGSMALIKAFGAVQVFTMWSASAKPLVATLGATSFNLLNIVGLLKAAPKGLITTFKNATKFTGSWSFGLKSAASHLGIVTKSIVGLLPWGTKLLAIFSGPIGWIASLGLLALSFKSVRSGIAKLWQATDGLGRLMKEMANIVVAGLTESLKPLVKWLGDAWVATKKFAGEAASFLVEFFSIAEVVKLVTKGLEGLVVWLGLATEGMTDLEKVGSVLLHTLNFMAPGVGDMILALQRWTDKAKRNIEQQDKLAASIKQEDAVLKEILRVYDEWIASLHKSTKALGDQSKASREAAERSAALVAAQKKWRDTLLTLRTPMENYVARLLDIREQAKAAGVSADELADAMSRLAASAKPLENLEFKALSPENWGLSTVKEVVKAVEQVISEMVIFDKLSFRVLTAWEALVFRVKGVKDAFIEAKEEIKEGFSQALFTALDELIHGADFEDALKELGGQMGMIVGAIAGGIIGGPIGAAIGAAVGKFLGEEVGKFVGKLMDSIFNKANLKDRIKDFFKDFDAGSASIKQTVKAVDLLIAATKKLSKETVDKLFVKYFDEILEAAKRLGGEAVDALKRLADAARETGKGLEVVEQALRDTMDEALGVLQDKMDAYGTAAAQILAGIEKMGLGTVSAVEFAAEAIVQAFNAMLLSGASIIDIVEALGEQFLRVQLAGEDLGLNLPKAFERVGVVIATLADETLKRAVTSLQGFGEVAKAVGDIGLLTGEQFTAFGNKIQGTFNKLIDGGLTSKEALASIAPQLQILYDLSQQYGFSINANTQALIDEAGAMGLITDKGLTTEDILIKGFDRILEGLNAIIVALGGVPIALNTWVTGIEAVEDTWSGAVGGIVDDTASAAISTTKLWFDIAESAVSGSETIVEAWKEAGSEVIQVSESLAEEVQKLWEDFDISIGVSSDLSGPVGGVSASDGTGGIVDFGAGTPAMLHGREEVLTEREGGGVAEMVANALSQASGENNAGLVRALQDISASNRRVIESNEAIQVEIRGLRL